MSVKNTNQLVYTRKFKVRGHDVSPQMVITIPALLKAMQECSFQHARNLKTSVWDMKGDQMTWVLIRKELKLIRPLKLDENYTVITYPSGFEKFFAFRDYLVIDENKKLVATASSTWTLLNTKTRKILRIPQNIHAIGIPKDLKFLPRPAPKLDVPLELSLADHRKVRHYDLDWNNHVNNLVLIRYMTEGLIDHYGLSDDRIKRLNVHFKNELILGDEVDVQTSISNTRFFGQLMVNHTIVAQLEWEPESEIQPHEM